MEKQSLAEIFLHFIMKVREKWKLLDCEEGEGIGLD